jgi:membrane fusion protein (multidrug efflux system)
MIAEKWQRFAKLRVLLPTIVLAVGAVFGLIKAYEYLRYSMKHVTTDDARVKGRMVSVAPEVSGMVKVLHVDEGSVVKAGEVLLELNDTTYRLQLEEAQAQAEMIERQVQEDTKEYALDIRRAEDQLVQARAELAAKQSALAEERTALALEVEQTRHQLVEAEAALKESESTVKEMQGQVRIATSNWERAQALFQEGIVPIANRDQAQDTLAQVQARLNATQERVAQLRARLSNAQTAQKRIQLRERKVQTLEAEIDKAQASVRLVQTELERSKTRQDRLQILEARLKEVHAKAERARQSLQDTVLRSPLAGVISRKRVEEGQLVQNGQPVLVISDPKDVWILANIKESYIRDVTVGKVVDIMVDAYPDRRFEGKVETIGAAAISEFAMFPPTGSFTKVEQRIPVQITVANTDGLLKPGMMVVIGIVKE